MIHRSKRAAAATATATGLVLALVASAFPARAAEPVELAAVGRYVTGLGEASAQIVAIEGDRAYVINTASTVIDILAVHSDGSLELLRRVELDQYGAGGNSVAAHDGVVAVALDGFVRTDPGSVVLLDRDGTVLTSVAAGAVPDMVTFTPDGKYLLVANEGEPNDEYTVDPEGSVTVINVAPLLARRGGAAGASGNLVRTASFTEVEIPEGVRLFGPGASAAQDLEPEYIAVDPDGRTAYITLQENNAIAVLDIQHASITEVLPLGLKDHRIAGQGLDGSDRNGISIQSPAVPVFGMYQPDAIAAFAAEGETYLITANEGDVREWGDYEEGARAGDLADDGLLDPADFPGGLPSALRRLTVSTASGDLDGDGLYDQLHVFGARSFAIWTTDGELVFDSGDEMEQIVKAAAPEAFNVSNNNNTVDNRSDEKGPEPEGVAVGTIGERMYAFIALERTGGVLVYDVTDPTAPVFQSWANTRDYTVAPGTTDSGPEGLAFVSAATSPTGAALLLVGNEVSGSVVAFTPTEG